ncbi:MAG TPA: hypothetical protein VK465_02145, partial [Fibrobacteria bacterium]|nr:hypothetical protein [Fibrobacteria bacterium]
PPAPTAASGTDTARAALGDTASREAAAADRADTAFAGRRAADSTADSTAPSTAAPAADGYRVPAFLRAPPLLPDTFPAPPTLASAQGYHSLLGIRPLLAWPYLTPGFREVAAGLGVLLEDPLSLHSLTLNAGVGEENSPLYDVAYTNAQTPVRITLWAANTRYDIDDIGQDIDSSGWRGDRTLYAIRHRTSMELSLSMRLPWPLPRPHALFLAAAVGSEYRQDRVGADGEGSREYLDRNISQEWTYHDRIGAGYAYALPYAYAAAHPLRETAFGISLAHQYPDYNRYVRWEALNTFPLYQELTLTLFHSGQWNHASRFRDDRWELPNGDLVYFDYLRERGVAWDVHAGMDLPLWKGWLAEVPLLGVCNFVGAGAYGAYGRQDFERGPHSSRPGYESTMSVGGGRIFSLFHVMRKIPLVLSLYAEQDFEEGGQNFGVSTEVGALPSRVTGFTSALDHMLPRPSRRAAGLEDRLRRASPLP